MLRSVAGLDEREFGRAFGLADQGEIAREHGVLIAALKQREALERQVEEIVRMAKAAGGKGEA